MSYASDLDLLFVFDDAGPRADERGEETAEALLRFVHGPSPAQRVATIDLGLRPEGARAAWPGTWRDTRATSNGGPRPGSARLCCGPAWWPGTGRSGSFPGLGPRLHLATTVERRRRGRHPTDEGPHRA